MTAAELVRVAEARGLCLKPKPGEDRIVVDGPEDALLELRADLIQAKSAVLVYLRERRAAVITAARLLREGIWAPVPPVCSFPIGYAGERCQRCGAPSLEHYGLRQKAADG